MNLLSLLLNTMLTKDSVNNLSAKTGISSPLVRKLIIMAIPILIRYMTTNASSQNGAASLFNALSQHTSNRSMADQIDEADAEDGDRIIHHILGDDNDQVVRQLATRSGLTAKQVITLLSLIAPALLSGLSAASNSAHQQSIAQPQNTGADLSSLMSMFGGSSLQASQPQQTQPASGMGGLGLLGTLLGMGMQANQASQVQQPAQSVLQQAFQQTAQQAYQQPVQQVQPVQQLNEQPVPQQLSMNGLNPVGSSGASDTSSLTNLFGSMLGLGASQAQPQTTESMLDGSQLLGILSQLYK